MRPSLGWADNTYGQHRVPAGRFSWANPIIYDSRKQGIRICGSGHYGG